MSELAALFEKVKKRFNAEAAADLDLVYQFRIQGGDAYHLVIKNGTCEGVAGEAVDPSVTLVMDTFDTVSALISGKLDGMKAFMTGKLKAKGDIMLATRLGSLFAA